MTFDPSSIRAKAEAALRNYHAARKATRVEKDELYGYGQALWAAVEARDILQAIASKVQSEAHGQIAGVVSKCLKTVFPDSGYSFRIHFDRKRGKTAARMVLVKRGHEIDPLTADSGGVVQVAAFALRVASLILATPKKRRLLVLDESFSMVSEEYVPNLARLLEVLCCDLNLQIILVTHQKKLRSGKVIELRG